MDFGFLLVFLVLLHLMPSLLGQNIYNIPTCPNNFSCQNLNPFHFSNPCGLCMASCDSHSPPMIKLNLWLDQWFEFRGKHGSNVMKLHDPTIQRLLNDRDCNSFNYDIDAEERWPQLISCNIVTNITLFKCGKNHDSSQEIDRYFQKYNRTDSCGEFEIYYRDPNSKIPTIHPDGPPPVGCSSAYLPMRPMDKISNFSNLFNLLTADFDLEWYPHDGSCDELCQLEVDQFKSYEISESDVCGINNSGKGKKKLKITIGTCVAGGAFLIFLAIFLILYKKRKGINFRSRKSSKLSSKLDLEGGSAIYFGVPVFSYDELEEVTNSFDISKELGSGGFGTVYYGKLRDGREVAVKRLYEHNFKRVAQFLNEVEILTRLRHPNLVSLYGCTSRRCRELLLVYEYIPNGTVADHLHGDRAKDQSLTWPVRMNIAIETAGALVYLHASDIIHRDVKTNNILLDHNFQVKVADFGLSRLFPNDVSHISTAPQGTPGYVDPDYHHCYQLTDKSDVYSFGVVLIELISSMPAVDIRRERDEINLANLAIKRIQRQAFSELIDPSLGYEADPDVMRMTSSVAELAFRCVQLEKQMRPTMDEVLETLKAIQDCNEDFIEMTKLTGENTDESRGRMVASTPELNDVALLRKENKFSFFTTF